LLTVVELVGENGRCWMDEGGVEEGGGGRSSNNNGQEENVSLRQVTPTSTHRLILGIVVLITVDVIWVASSELSEVWISFEI